MVGFFYVGVGRFVVDYYYDIVLYNFFSFDRFDRLRFRDKYSYSVGVVVYVIFVYYRRVDRRGFDYRIFRRDVVRREVDRRG